MGFFWVEYANPHKSQQLAGKFNSAFECHQAHPTPSRLDL